MAEKIDKGVSPREVLLDAGYSPVQAAKGFAAIPDGVKKLLTAKAKRLIAIGASIDPLMQEKLVRGRLVENVTRGKDGGAQSAKILGSDRRVNMFTPDMQTGVVFLGDPPLFKNMSQEERAKLLEAPEE